MNLARSCGSAEIEQCSTAQSSTEYSGPPQLANDGIKDATFSHTGYDENPWWRVDFGGTKLIAGGTIWNRADQNAMRLDGFKLWIGESPIYNGPGNTNCYTATTTQHGTSPYTHSFACTGWGRYFFVHLPRRDWLHMREVEVLGSGPGENKSSIVKVDPGGIIPPYRRDCCIR